MFYIRNRCLHLLIISRICKRRSWDLFTFYFVLTTEQKFSVEYKSELKRTEDRLC